MSLTWRQRDNDLLDNAHEREIRRNAFDLLAVAETQASLIPASKETGMGWVHEICAIHGIKHEYQQFSRRWLRDRFSADNMATRITRRDSIWWERETKESRELRKTLSAEKQLAFMQAAANLGAMSRGGRSRTVVEGPAPLKKKQVDLLTLGQLSVKVIMAVETLRVQFTQWLDANFTTITVDFLDAVEKWHEMFDNHEHKTSPEQKASLARRIYSTYMMEGDDSLVLSEGVRKPIHDIVNVDSDAAGADTKPPELKKELFDAAQRETWTHLETETWKRFISSSAFKEIKQAFDDLVAQERTKRDHLEKDKIDKTIVVDFDKGDGKVTNMAGRYGQSNKAPGWHYDKNFPPYESLFVDLVAARGATIEHKQPQLYALVSVDSMTLKTKPVSDKTKKEFLVDHMEMTMTATTQYIDISLYNHDALGDLFMGYVSVPVATVMAEKPLPGSVTRQWKGWVKLHPRPGVHDKVDSELQLQITLVHAPRADLGHEQVFETLERSAVANVIRGAVSMEKTRYQTDGFDLDLSYITPHVLSMGFPSEAIEGVYRNHISDVQKFLLLRHRQAYKLYNLCSEKDYSSDKFENQVSRYPFDDHGPPTMQLLADACRDMHDHLQEHPQNVCAVHCKAGKGRTGTVVCAYLLYDGTCQTADEALAFFAAQRTKNQQGVTIPSQIRYVHYFEKYVRLKRTGQLTPAKSTLFLLKVVFAHKPVGISVNMGDFWIEIDQPAYVRPGVGDKIRLDVQPTLDAENHIVFDMSSKLIPFNEDVCVSFNVKSALGKEKIFSIWLNTRYHEFVATEQLGSRYPRRCRFTKAELDKAVKDKKDKIYPSDFWVDMYFANTAMSSAVKDIELVNPVRDSMLVKAKPAPAAAAPEKGRLGSPRAGASPH